MAKTPTTNKAPAKATPPAPVLPTGARTSFRGLQEHLHQTVTMRRQDNTLVRGRLERIEQSDELDQPVATLTCSPDTDDENVEAVRLDELQYWLPPTKDGAAREPGQAKRTGIPQVITLKAGDDLLAALSRATGTTVTLAPSRTDRFNPTEVDGDGDDDDDEGERVQAGESFDADDLVDDDAVEALNAAIAEQVPPEEPPAEAEAEAEADPYDLVKLGEQIDAKLKQSPRAAKAAATRAYPKAAQVAKGGKKGK